MERERAEQLRAAEEAERKKKEAEERKKEAEARVKQEARNREREKQIKILDEMEATKKKAILSKLGKTVADYNVSSLKDLDADKLAKEQMEQVQKKKDDADSRVKEKVRASRESARALCPSV